MLKNSALLLMLGSFPRIEGILAKIPCCKIFRRNDRRRHHWRVIQWRHVSRQRGHEPRPVQVRRSSLRLLAGVLPCRQETSDRCWRNSGSQRGSSRFPDWHSADHGHRHIRERPNAGTNTVNIFCHYWHCRVRVKVDFDSSLQLPN